MPDAILPGVTLRSSDAALVSPPAPVGDRNSVSVAFDRLDRRITGWMAAHGVFALRIALGIVFFWFGALKLVPGLSPAEDLAGRTIETADVRLVPASVALPMLALWEVAIGWACSSAAGCA